MTEPGVLLRFRTQLLKELEDMIRHHQNVSTGRAPMDGCLECSSDYYAPIEQNKVLECYLAGASDREVRHAIEKGLKKTDQDNAEAFLDTVENGRKQAGQNYAEIIARAIEKRRKKTGQDYAEIVA